MRHLFVVLLALAVVAAPAAHAYACGCAEQAAAQEGACCCGDSTACDCCDVETEPGAVERCPCTHSSPLTPDAPTLDMPTPDAALATCATLRLPVGSQRALAAPEPRDPNPDISLPLLI